MLFIKYSIGKFSFHIKEKPIKKEGIGKRKPP
jgi:hypothetical protein